MRQTSSRKRKALALVGAFAAAIAVAGCSSSGSSDNDTSAQESTTQESTTQESTAQEEQSTQESSTEESTTEEQQSTEEQTAEGPAYPTKGIELVVPYPAGGGIDLPGRIIADYAAKAFGQPISVINRPGASGVTGVQSVISQPNDGYSLLVESPGSSSSQVLLQTPYDIMDRTYIVRAVSLPMVLVASTASGWTSMKDVVDAAKSDPASFKWASVGPTTVADFAIKEFLAGQGVDLDSLKKVSYEGGPAGLAAIASGDVDLGSGSLGSVLPFAQSKTLTVVGVLLPERSELLPDVATADEQGYTGLTAAAWVGISGPAGVPQSVVDAWQDVVKEALQDPDVNEQLSKLSATGTYADSTDFTDYVKKQSDIFKQLG